MDPRERAEHDSQGAAQRGSGAGRSTTGPDRRHAGSEPPPMSTDVPPSGSGRRKFLRGMLGAGATAAVTGAAVTGYAARAAQAARGGPSTAVQAADPGATLPAVPFHGPHQAGILPVPQRQVLVCSCDVTASDRGELTDALRALTDRAAFLTAGGTPPPAGRTGPPADSGILGPTVVPDGCLLYTSDAADDLLCVDLGGRRIIK